MLRKISIVCALVASVFACGGNAKPTAVAPAPSTSTPAITGRPVLRYLPTTCSRRLLVDGGAVSSLVDTGARRLFLSNIHNKNSSWFWVAPFIDPVIDEAALAAPFSFELAVCVSKPDALTFVLQSDRYASLDALEADVSKIAAAPNTGHWAPIVRFRRDRIQGVDVLRVSFAGQIGEAWAAIVAPKVLVVSFNPSLTPASFAPRAPTWVLAPETVFAYSDEPSGVARIAVVTHPMTIDLDIVKPAGASMDRRQVQRLADLFFGNWPDLYAAIGTWHLEGDTPQKLHVSVPRAAFVTQSFDWQAAYRKDFELFCEPWKFDDHARTIAADKSITSTQKMISLGELAAGRIVTSEVRWLAAVLSMPGGDPTMNGYNVREGAKDLGVAVDSCPSMELVEWDTLCHNKLDDGLALLAKGSPVARDVLAQPPKERPAYVKKRAHEVYMDDCPMAPRTP